MGLEIKQSLRLSQQLVMTPQLQQAIKLLQLSRMELVDTINQELMENPMLEATEEADAEPVPGEESEAVEAAADKPDNEAGEGSSSDSDSEAAESGLEEVAVHEEAKEEFDWENYLEEYSSAPAPSESSIREDRDTPSYDNLLTRSASLREHLLWQLRLAPVSEDEMTLGAHIIGNLNPDGYLKSSLEEMAQAAGAQPQQLERVLGLIQQFDPLGVAARDLRECLIIQATELYPGHDLVHDILESHLPDLERRNFQVIAKKLGVSMDDVAEAIDVIRRLDPKPGRTVSEEEPRYITPDIYVHKLDGEYVIVLNEDGLPKLKVNSFYKEALGAGAAPEARDYVQNKLRGALWLIRSIHQRQRTIYKVTESIVKHQRDFLDRGIAFLKPMVLRDVAEDVSMHESTISRVTTNKYVHTPQGVFELKFFFNSGINRMEGGAVASEAVKDRIRQFIAAENQQKPYSDQHIADMLAKENIDIARRTVAKYRELLGILPSSRRRQPLGAFGKKK